MYLIKPILFCNKPVSVFSILFLCFLILPVVGKGWTKKNKKVNVVCIGDSITFGARTDDPTKESYPAQLQLLLGDDYLVKNLGISSCTLLKKATPSVWNELSKIKASNPNIIVISLGTNDTCGMGTCGNRMCWEYIEEFYNDYLNLIDIFQNLSSNPKIWICAPSPMVLETPGLTQERINGLSIRKPRLQKLIGLVKKVAKEKNVNFIDLNTSLDHQPELFTIEDGVHPNKIGYQIIAELVYRELKR